jgi:hypothetical protein
MDENVNEWFTSHENARRKNSVSVVFYEPATWFTTTGTLIATTWNLELYESMQQKPDECPLNGKWKVDNFVYKAMVTTTDDGNTKEYISKKSTTVWIAAKEKLKEEWH